MTDLTSIPESRAFHFSRSGDDNNEGGSANLPYVSPNKAQEMRNLLVPPPDPLVAGSQAAIINTLAGSYSNVFLDELDVTLLSAPNSTFIGDPTKDYVMAMGGSNNHDIATVLATKPSGSAVVCDNKTRTAMSYKFLSTLGGGSCCVLKLTGDCDDYFLTGGQIGVNADYTGILDQVVTSSAGNHAPGLITLDGANAVGFEFSGAEKALSFGTIVARNGATNTVGGIVDCECTITGNRIEADKGLVITANGDAVVDVPKIVGDIENNGLLEATIIKHTGAITGSGAINGNINGVKYGTYVDNEGQFLAVLNTRSNISSGGGGTQGGFLPWNTATDQMNSITLNYRQTSSQPRTVIINIIDSSTGVVYFSGVSAQASAGNKELSVPTTPINPLPSNTALTLQVIYSRSGPGGVLDPTTTFFFSRTT